jgi:hypothetical protein
MVHHKENKQDKGNIRHSWPAIAAANMRINGKL